MTEFASVVITPSKHNENVLLMSCCSGHGFKYAPMYGAIAEDWLEGRPSKELDAFGLDKRMPPATGLGAGT